MDKPSVFIEFKKLFIEYKKAPTLTLQNKLDDIVSQVPTPDRPETWIGLKELNLLKEYWCFTKSLTI